MFFIKGCFEFELTKAKLPLFLEKNQESKGFA
jgi:hypothetical protein